MPDPQQQYTQQQAQRIPARQERMPNRAMPHMPGKEVNQRMKLSEKEMLPTWFIAFFI